MLALLRDANLQRKWHFSAYPHLELVKSLLPRVNQAKPGWSKCRYGYYGGDNGLGNPTDAFDVQWDSLELCGRRQSGSEEQRWKRNQYNTLYREENPADPRKTKNDGDVVVKIPLSGGKL